MISEICKISELKITDFPPEISNSNSKVINKKPLKLTCGSFYLPKRKKARPQGEDAHFICTGKNAIGVADGVGAWAAEGVDAGKYARDLMANAVTALNRQTKGSIDPARVLQLAYRKTRVRGSSTALIIALNKNSSLRYANLGDSGLIVFREKKSIYESPIQQHSFNCPYQLGTGGDAVNLAYEGEICVEEGDIVVAATDGVLDNMYISEIEGILDRSEAAADFDGEKLAAEIVECAYRNSVNGGYFSPFAKAAKEAGVERRGGKYDDITVVVAKIELDL